MAIRAGFLTVALGFWSSLMPGAVQHGAAEPRWSGLGDLLPPRPEEVLVCTDEFPFGVREPDPAGAEADAGVDDDEAIEQTLPAPMIASLTGARVGAIPAFETAVETTVMETTGIGRPSFGPGVGDGVRLNIGKLGSTETSHYPIVANSQVGYFLDRFTRERREVISTWLGRSGRVMSLIRETLKKPGCRRIWRSRP
jgi:hypothetical protein